MSQKDFFPPPGQQEPTNHNDHLPSDQNPGQQMPEPNVPLNQKTMPQQLHMPTNQRSMPQPQSPLPGQQPMPQPQYVSPGQQPMPQPMPQPHYVPPGQQPMAQPMPQPHYVPPGQQPMPQPMPQPQYIPPGQQPMSQQQYVQQMPSQYYQPQYQQQRPGQQYSVGAQPMQGPMAVQSPSPFLGVPLQPWSSELFDCAQDMENCIITAIFPCITFGQIAEITDRGMSSCMSSGLIYGLLMYFTYFHWVYSWAFRTRLRATYSLAEDPLHDCLVHAFCDPCALCQEYRELKSRGFIMEIGWLANMEMQNQKAAAAACAPPPGQNMTR